MTDPKDRYPSQEIEPDASLDETSDFQSDLDDVIDIDQDFDAEEEADGIFEPQAKKRKSSTKTLLGILLLLIVLGGGGYYYLTLNESDVSDPISVAQSAPFPETPAAETVSNAIPQPVSDFAPEAPVAPAPVDVVSQPPLTDNVPEVPPSEVVTDSPSPAPIIADTSSFPEVPSVPEADNTRLPTIDDPLTPQPVEDTQTIPNQADLATPSIPLPQSKAPTPDIAVSGNADDLKTVRQNVVTPTEKKGGLVQKEYFDSPEGKSLKNFAPPPSINPFGVPGENIIIVRKGPSEDVVVTRGEDNGFVESKLVSANRAMALGKYDAALNFYNELRKKNQSDPRILMGRAVALQKLGEKEQAIDAYNDLLDVDPQNPEALTNLMGLVSKSQPARALQNLLELREKFPRNPAVAAQLGVAYAQSGNPQDGIRYLGMASKLQPENPLHFFNMAVLAEQMNNKSEAIKLYEQSLDTSSIYPEQAAKAGFSRDQVYDRLSRLRGQ